MSANEPFLPVTHVGGDDIDAADPGFGAPGSSAETALSDEEIAAAEEAFEQRMDAERGNESLFRTPSAQQHHDPPSE